MKGEAFFCNSRKMSPPIKVASHGMSDEQKNGHQGQEQAENLRFIWSFERKNLYLQPQRTGNPSQMGGSMAYYDEELLNT